MTSGGKLRGIKPALSHSALSLVHVHAEGQRGWRARLPSAASKSAATTSHTRWVLGVSWLSRFILATVNPPLPGPRRAARRVILHTCKTPHTPSPVLSPTSPKEGQSTPFFSFFFSPDAVLVVKNGKYRLPGCPPLHFHPMSPLSCFILMLLFSKIPLKSSPSGEGIQRLKGVVNAHSLQKMSSLARGPNRCRGRCESRQGTRGSASIQNHAYAEQKRWSCSGYNPPNMAVMGLLVNQLGSEEPFSEPANVLLLRRTCLFFLRMRERQVCKVNKQQIKQIILYNF